MTAQNASPQETAGRSAASSGVADWQLRALLSPAVVRLGDRTLPTGPRLFLDQVLQLSALCVERLIKKEIEFEQADVAAAGVFGAIFDLGGGRNMVITVDDALARAATEHLTINMTKLRGSGTLTDAELGVLEFVSLTLVDAVSQHLRASEQGAVLTAFLDGAELSQWLTSRSLASIAWNARIEARGGVCQCWLDNEAIAAFNALQPADPMETQPALADHFIALSVAFPPIELSRTEVDALEPGDLLLIGAKDFSHLAGQLRIATETGWTIATATAQSDSPTAISVKAGNLVIDTLPTSSDSSIDAVLISACIGSAEVSLAQLKQWQAGATMGFAKDATAPVTLRVAGETVGRGELVRFDDEMAIHVLESALET